MIKQKYTCVSTSGGGTNKDEGIWERIETDKTLTFLYDDVLHFEPNYPKIRINKFYSKRNIRKDNNYNAFRDFNEDGISYRSWMNNRHVIRDWLDGTYTAYPEQCGTPYYFEPLKPL